MHALNRIVILQITDIQHSRTTCASRAHVVYLSLNGKDYVYKYRVCINRKPDHQYYIFCIVQRMLNNIHAIWQAEMI